MKILISGAHFTPAQAVIESLQKLTGVKIVYVGRRFTMEGDTSARSNEEQILSSLGVKFIPSVTGRLQYHLTRYTIPSLLKIPLGFCQAFGIILQEKPDVILSFGGYVAVPMVVWGWLFSIPIIIHEQTLVGGLSNRISAFFADKVAVSFKVKYPFPKDKVVLTGNPLRGDFLNPPKYPPRSLRELFIQAKTHKLPIIVVTGGNQGSHVINQMVSQIINDLTKIACVIHQTGDSKFGDYEKLIRQRMNLKYHQRVVLEKWFRGGDFGFVLKWADLVVTRAGANTLMELAYFGIPALVIPISYLYGDEQNKNAKFFQEMGLARVLSQGNLSPEKLFREIKSMIKDLPKLKERAKRQDVVVKDAAKKLALETLMLGRKY